MNLLKLIKNSIIIRGRLPRRIALWIFLSIVLVEVLILIPSAINFERDELNYLKQLGLATARNAVMIDQENLQHLNRDEKANQLHRAHYSINLRSTEIVTGIAVYNPSGNLLTSAGEPQHHSVAELLAQDFGSYVDHQGDSQGRFETAILQELDGLPLVIAVRLKSGHVFGELVHFIGRITSLVLLISSCVCAVTMLVLNKTVIGPLFEINERLEIARIDPINANRRKLMEGRTDELGDVYFSINQLLETVSSFHREELGMLAAMIDNSTSAAIAYDSKGQLIYVNHACLKLFGAEEEKDIWAQNGPRLKYPDNEVTLHLPELKTQENNTEIEFIDAEGNAISCLLSSGHLTDEEGLVTRYFATLTDLTAIRRVQKRLNDAIESISEGFTLFNAEDQLVLFNSRAFDVSATIGVHLETGMTYREIIEKAGETMQHTTPADEVKDWISHRLAERANSHSSYTLKLTEDRWINANESRVSDGGMAAVMTDISEVKLRERQLTKLVGELEIARDEAMDASRIKSEFLANISHELRTPLNAIIGYSQLVQEDVEDLGASEVLPDLGRIESSGKHLLELINSILDLSKIEAGKMEVFVDNFHVKTVINEAITLVQPLIEKNDNSFSWSIEEEIGDMVSDGTKLRQTLVNLIGNAAKFTEGGSINLKVFSHLADKQMICFRVEDTGIGMTNDQVTRLYQPFTQADGSTTREFGGTGLGLAISKHYAQMLGGDITVESRLDEGSTFILELPVDSTEDVEVTASLPPAETNAGGKIVLVIDDDSDFRTAIGHSLTDEGYQILEAANGREGLEVARNHQPDIIMLDVIMPDIEGWSVLKALKEDPETQSIPVLLVSALMHAPELGESLGAFEMFSKPIDKEKLITTIRECRAVSHTPDILVVDDDLATCNLMCRAVERQGWSATSATSGREALEKLCAFTPNVILLDLMMPEMDGFEVLRKIAKLDHKDEIAVFVLTAKDLSQEETHWLSSRVVEIFQKGHYERSKLIGSVRDILAQNHVADTPKHLTAQAHK